MCDNQSVINIVIHPIQHDQTKHIEIDHHFAWQKVEEKDIDSVYIKTDDIFIKGLIEQKVWFLKDKLNMIQDDVQLEGGW